MIVKSCATLCNDHDMISDLAHKEAAPIYITQNSESDIVIMSIEVFEKREEALELRARLIWSSWGPHSGNLRRSHSSFLSSTSPKAKAIIPAFSNSR